MRELFQRRSLRDRAPLRVIPPLFLRLVLTGLATAQKRAETFR